MADVETLDSNSSSIQQEEDSSVLVQQECDNLMENTNDIKQDEFQDVTLSDISTSSSPSVIKSETSSHLSSSTYELSNYFGIGHLLEETQEYLYETSQFTSCSQQCHEFLFKFHHGLLSSKHNSLMIDYDWEDHLDVVSVILQLVNQSEEKTIELTSTQLKAKIHVKCDESNVDLQFKSISGIPLTSWIGKLVLPLVKFSHLPSKLSNLKEYIPLSEELCEEMKTVFFSSYPSLFRQYFNHFPNVNDQKNANMVLAEYLIGLLWIGCLNVEKSDDVSSKVKTVVQKSIDCLEYWIRNYGFTFDVLSSNFVKSSLQQVDELLSKIEKNDWKDQLNGVVNLFSEESLNRNAFPLAFSEWLGYLSNKRKELGLDEEEEEETAEEEENQEESTEEEFTQVEEEGEDDEEEEDEEEEVDVSEMFFKLSSFILSQHDLQAIEIPKVFADHEKILLANLPNETENISSIVLDILSKSVPEKASFFEGLAQPDLYLQFIMQWSPLEIAKQLTNYEFTNHFEQCKAHDFFSTGALSNNQSNLDQMIDRFNWMSLWIVYTILRQENLENRVNIIGYFVQVMFFTLSLQNFQNTMCIISAFHNSCISKLTTSWKEVSELKDQTNTFTYHQFLAGVNDLLSLQKKFFKLKYHIIQNIERNLEEESHYSCIPYVGVWLGEISSIETYYNDFVSPPTHLKHHHSHISSSSNSTVHTHQLPHHYLFNYEKKRLITKPLKEIQTFQKLSLNSDNENISLFKSVPLLLHILSTNEMIKTLPLDTSNNSSSPGSNVGGLLNDTNLSINSDLSPALSNFSLSSNGSGFFQGQSTVMLKSITNSEYLKKIFREMTKEIIQKE